MFNIVLIYCMFNIVLRSKDVTYMFTINDGITHNVKHQKQLERLGGGWVPVFGTVRCMTNQDRRELHYGSWFHTMQDVPPSITQVYIHTSGILTLSCMSGLAPAPSRSSTTLW